MLTASQDFERPYWLTFKQAADLGGKVKKGEKATPITLWKFGRSTEQNDNGEETAGKRWAWCTHFSVFNVSQVDGLDVDGIVKERTRKQERIEFTPIEACEAILKSYIDKPEFISKAQRAFYNPANDLINMPAKNSFDSEQAYYATLFHELTHSTGHAKRLNRDGVANPAKFASHAYGQEELVAELGAAFLCSHAGIDSVTMDNHAAYLNSWIKTLKGDPRMIVTAASRAQKAAELILGTLKEYEEKAGA